MRANVKLGDIMRKQPANESALKSSVASLGLTLGLAIGSAAFMSAFPGTAFAGPLEDALSAARQDVEQGRCEQAERRLAGVAGLEGRARLLAGQCQIRAGLYPEALNILDSIRGDRDGLSSEQVGDVELYRAVALYHLERYTEANAALTAAEGLSSDEAQLSLYRGLIALRDGDNDRAAPALESAARLSPELTEPVASYYAGLAWQGAAERTRAREAFQRVVALDGDGPWGKEAKKLLEATELFPYFVRGKIGVELDDNVLLRGDVAEIADDRRDSTRGESDWRGVWGIDAGIQLFQSDDGEWSGGATASYTGNNHVDLFAVDIHYPTVGAYVANRLGTDTIGQARYQFGHAWVNDDPYLRSHVAEISIAHTWTRAGTTIALVDVLANDLRFQPFEVQDGTGPSGTNAPCPGNPFGCSPAGVNETSARNRDGIGYGAGLEHRYLVPVPKGLNKFIEQLEIGGGYRFRYYDSEGEEWEHFSHILNAGVNIELPLDFSIATRISYEYRDFANPSTFPDVETPDVEYTLSGNDRSEHEVVFEGEIEKDLTDNLSVSGRYSYLSNDSNRDAYNYDRHIVGGYLKFRFD